MRTYIPVKNPKQSQTHVCLEIDYEKDRRGGRGIWLDAYPVGLEENCVSRAFSLCGGPGPDRSVLLVPLARGNPQKLAAAWAKAKQEIESRQGQAWDMALAVAAALGTGIEGA